MSWKFFSVGVFICSGWSNHRRLEVSQAAAGYKLRAGFIHTHFSS